MDYEKILSGPTVMSDIMKIGKKYTVPFLLELFSNREKDKGRRYMAAEILNILHSI